MREKMDDSQGIENGSYSLHMAAQQGLVAVVSTTIAGGVPVNIADLEGQTPLHFAACLGHVAVVQCLLDAGADAALADNSGVNSLHSASMAGKDTIVSMIYLFTGGTPGQH